MIGTALRERSLKLARQRAGQQAHLTPALSERVLGRNILEIWPLLDRRPFYPIRRAVGDDRPWRTTPMIVAERMFVSMM